MEKNVWVIYNEYNNIVNDLIYKEIGHINRLSPEVIARQPHSMLQSLILIDVLNEIKILNEKVNKLIETNSNKEKSQKETKTSAVKK